MGDVPISELYKHYVGKNLSELPDEFVKRSRVLWPKTEVEPGIDFERINIVLDKNGQVTYIIGG